MSLPIAQTPIFAVLASAVPQVRHATAGAGAHLDVLMLLSFLGMFATLVGYLEIRRSNSHRLAFALGLAGMALCGLFQGMLGLSILAFLWSVSNMRQWNDERKLLGLWNKPASRAPISSVSEPYGSESRITRLFGSAGFDQKRWNSDS